MKYFICFFFFCSYLQINYSQTAKWKFENVSIYDSKTKKSVPQKVSGTIITDTALHLFWIVEDKVPSILNFNSCKLISLTDSSCEYELGNYTLGEKNISIFLKYNANPRFPWLNILKMTSDGKSKTFFIKKEDSTITSNDFINLIKKTFDRLHFEWIKIYDDDEGYVSFVQNKKLPNSDEKYIKIWKKDFLKTIQYKKLTYKNVKCISLLLVDCENKRMAILSNSYYTSKDKFIYSYEEPYTDWQQMTPETVGELIVNEICKLFN